MTCMLDPHPHPPNHSQKEMAHVPCTDREDRATDGGERWMDGRMDGRKNAWMHGLKIKDGWINT